MTWEELAGWLARNGWREGYGQDIGSKHVFRIFVRGHSPVTFVDGPALQPDDVRRELGKEMILRANTARARKRKATGG